MVSDLLGFTGKFVISAGIVEMALCQACTLSNRGIFFRGSGAGPGTSDPFWDPSPIPAIKMGQLVTALLPSRGLLVKPTRPEFLAENSGIL